MLLHRRGRHGEGAEGASQGGEGGRLRLHPGQKGELQSFYKIGKLKINYHF
mgnify:CR=1 FL=1